MTVEQDNEVLKYTDSCPFNLNSKSNTHKFDKFNNIFQTWAN